MPSARVVAAGAHRLSVLEHGQGAPIIFLHAFPLHGQMWESQLDALPAGWHGVAPDLRGFRHSPRTDPARQVADHAADVLAIVDAIGGGPAVIAGLSMGGYIAFECWRQRPAAIRGLVLADTCAEPDTDEARSKRVAMQGRAAEEGVAAVIDAMLPSLLGATTQAGDPHRSVQVRAWAMQNAPDGIIDALDVLKTRPDSRPTLASITCPVLVIVGAEDILTTPANAATIADGVRTPTLVEIASAGHLSSVEQSASFNARLHDWLGSGLPA